MSPRKSDQLNAGATSETAQKGKTIHTKHTLSHPNMMIMMAKWYSGTLGGLKFPDICLTGEEKPRKKKPHPGNLSRPGIEPGPAAWQERMLPLAPEGWTNRLHKKINEQCFSYNYRKYKKKSSKMWKRVKIHTFRSWSFRYMLLIMAVWNAPALIMTLFSVTIAGVLFCLWVYIHKETM